jgi:hypothetical protein
MNRNHSVVTFLLVLMGSVLETSVAWCSLATVRGKSRSGTFSTTSLFESNVGTISLLNLTDHEKEGTLLAESIARWLDHEVSFCFVDVSIYKSEYCDKRDDPWIHLDPME